MKNLMFCTYLLFFSTVTYGQIKDNTIVDNFFYTTLKSGVGEEVQLKFKFGAKVGLLEGE
jgi:hypothetical protein